MTDNVIQFKKREPGHPPENPILYATIYPNSTMLTDPNSDMVDKSKVAEILFDSTFHVLSDADACLALVSIGAYGSQTFRQPDAFDTPARRAWLRRRLDEVYETLTGQPRSEITLRTFITRLNPFRKGS
jgi:hypothetical protein